MTTHTFNTIPFWLTHPTNLQNVIHNQLASLKEVPSFIHLPNKSPFTSGLRQAIYWKKRLSPSATNNTVIFTFLGSQGLIFPDVLEVCQALGNVCDISNIIEIYRATNSNFLGISFNNHLDASKVRNSLIYYKDSIVIHVPIASPLVHHFKLLWLPPLFPDSRIHHFFNKHAAKHSFTRDTILTDINTHTPSNSVSGSLELSPHSDIDKLPHLIPLPSPHLGNAFLIISGRSPFCLRCGQVGHVRRSCPAPRCSTCHQYHLSSSPCTSCDPALHAALLDSSLFDEDPDPVSSIALTTDDVIQLYSIPVPIPCDFKTHPPIDASLSTSSTPVLISTFISSSDSSPHTPALDKFSPSLSEALVSSPPTAPSTQGLNKFASTNPASSSPTSTTIAAISASSVVVHQRPLMQSSHNTSLTKRSRKCHKRHLSNSSSASSYSTTIVDSVVPPSTSWAEQVEEDISLLTSSSTIADNASSDPHQAIISASSSFDSMDSLVSPSLSKSPPIVPTTSSEPALSEDPDDKLPITSNPPLLTFLAAKAVIFHRRYIPPEAFLPTISFPCSDIFITCSCEAHFHIRWPVQAHISCPKCFQILTYKRTKQFFLFSHLPYIFLMLSSADYTDPISIDYLLTSLRLKVPLVPYIYYPKPPTHAFLQSLKSPSPSII